MKKSELLNGYLRNTHDRTILDTLNREQSIHLTGLTGSITPIIGSQCFKTSDQNFIFILPDKEEAAYFHNDLEQFIPEKDLLFYPGSYRRPYQIEETDNANVLLRAEILKPIKYTKKTLLYRYIP